MTRGARYSAVFLFVFSVLLATANLLWSSRQYSQANARTRAQCQFDADIGGAPIAVNVATGKASVLSVTIVSDARVAWHHLGCPGALAPPDPSFAHWAAYYRLPVN